MALSFEESRRLIMQQALTPATMSLRREATIESDEWTPLSNYRWFDNYEYGNEQLSTIDSHKNITVDDSQINIYGEVNSQFIPFEMNRKYDGIDITKMAISIHFLTSSGEHYACRPVNVEYCDSKIRFAWLIDANASSARGNIKFEVHADGVIYDRAGTEHVYHWRTKPTDRFTVYESLCENQYDDEDIDTSNDGFQEMIEAVAEVTSIAVAERVTADTTKQVVDEITNKIMPEQLEPFVNDTIDEAVSWGRFP